MSPLCLLTSTLRTTRLILLTCHRTHQSLSDQVAQTYGWNDQALMRFNETLKDASDPNGILAPGRCGIWPRKYRGKGWEILPVENGVREKYVPDS